MGNSSDSGSSSIFNPAKIIQDLFVETDFESRGHPDMEKMIEAADPGTTRRLGEKLVKASKEINKIGGELKARRDKVEWDSEGGDSFRDWITQMSSATLRLGEMSEGAGKWMQTAADTLDEVKRDMPKYSASAKSTLDEYMSRNPAGLLTLGSRQPDSSSGSGVLTGPSQGDAYDASQKLANDHGEAVRQMRKLAQSYSMSSMAIGATEAPTFPRIPNDLMPPKPEPRDGTYVGGESEGQGAQTSSSMPIGGERSTAGSVSPAPAQIDRQVGTEIAGGVAMPDAPTNPAGPANPAQTGPSGPANPSPVLGAPPISPVTNPGLGRVGPGQGTFTGKSVPGNTTGRMPGVPGQNTANPRAFGRMAGDHGNGIYGGRQGTPANAQPPRSLARGTVIGAEAAAHGQQNRSMMTGRAGMGMGMGSGMGPGGANQPGIVGGRSLAARPGGMVGNSLLRPGMPAGQPFTPGGSGLARGASSGGANAVPGQGTHAARGVMGGTPAGRPGETRDEKGQRPDYLVEDEETWSQKNQRIAPPVIE